MSSHDLEIEIGRYDSKPKLPEERLCSYCRTLRFPFSEDEVNFLIYHLLNGVMMLFNLNKVRRNFLLYRYRRKRIQQRRGRIIRRVWFIHYKNGVLTKFKCSKSSFSLYVNIIIITAAA